MEHDYCVYMHTFPNGKRYIGITCCKPNRRWQNGYGYVNQPVIHNAIVKYGWNSIKHEIILDNLTLDEANDKEQELIAFYQTTNRTHGYNVELGGKACGHLTDEHKQKISVANSGKNNGMYGHQYSEEDRARLAKIWLGRKHTEETRRKLHEYAISHPEQYSHKGENHPLYGKHPSSETRKKQSESAKKRGYCGSKNKRVDMLTVDGAYIRTFDSIQEAARFIGKKNGAPNIRSVCLGDRGKAHGFKWRYADVS
jgi:group I intron endonuclease